MSSWNMSGAGNSAAGLSSALSSFICPIVNDEVRYMVTMLMVMKVFAGFSSDAGVASLRMDAKSNHVNCASAGLAFFGTEEPLHSKLECTPIQAISATPKGRCLLSKVANPIRIDLSIHGDRSCTDVTPAFK